jgi:hypothetical protein
MQNLTLQQLFGTAALQDATTLVIHKSDLPGLTPNANNSAESLLIAILLQAWNEFEGLLADETGEAVVDEMGDAIGYDDRDLYEKLNVWFWKRQLTGGRVLDTFVINCFIKPPPSYGVVLSADRLSHA